MLQFKVSGLEDIRTLYSRWQAVLDRLKEKSGCKEDIEAHRQVGVEVEWRRPGEEVCLNFVAPPALLKRFLDDLREQGLDYSQEEIVPWMVVRCRLLSQNLQ
jgi:hypothetical protein